MSARHPLPTTPLFDLPEDVLAVHQEELTKAVHSGNVMRVMLALELLPRMRELMLASDDVKPLITFFNETMKSAVPPKDERANLPVVHITIGAGGSVSATVSPAEPADVVEMEPADEDDDRQPEPSQVPELTAPDDEYPTLTRQDVLEFLSLLPTKD